MTSRLVSTPCLWRVVVTAFSMAIVTRQSCCLSAPVLNDNSVIARAGTLYQALGLAFLRGVLPRQHWTQGPLYPPTCDRSYPTLPMICAAASYTPRVASMADPATAATTSF